MSSIRVTDKGLTQRQIGVVLSFEELHANDDIEYGLTVDENGNIIKIKKGTGKEIEWNGYELPWNGVMTHNHPLDKTLTEGSRFYKSVGQTFSSKDISMAIDNNLAEIRVRTPNYIFSMRRGKSSWGMTGDEFSHIYATRYKKEEKTAREYIGEKGISQTEREERIGRVNVNLPHTVMKGLAKTYGFIYTRAKVK